MRADARWIDADYSSFSAASAASATSAMTSRGGRIATASVAEPLRRYATKLCSVPAAGLSTDSGFKVFVRKSNVYQTRDFA